MAPNDPPAPRRSTRSCGPEVEGVVSNSRKNTSVPGEPIVRSSRGLDLEPVCSLPPECESPETNNNKQRIRIVRNVGGWISPDFANDVQRSWLESCEPMQPFNVSYYVPQIGDTVL